MSIGRAYQFIISHSDFHLYLFNTSWIFIEKIVRVLVGLLVTIAVARYLGPEGFGTLNYCIAFVVLFSAIARMGLDAIVVRELVDSPSNRDEILGAAFWLKFLGACIAIFFVCAALTLTSHDVKTNLYILIISSGLILQSIDVVDLYFQARVLNKYSTICRILQTVFSSLVKLYLVYAQSELIWFVLVYLLDQVLLAVFFYVASSILKFNNFFSNFNLFLMRKLITHSWPMMLSSVAVVLYMRIDQVMIKAMLGDHEVGIYSSSVMLVELLYFIPVAVTGSLFPAILNAKKSSEKIYYKNLQYLFTLLTWGMIFISLICLLNVEKIITLLFGSKYQDASSVFVVHIWSSIFVTLGVISGKWLVAERMETYALLRVMCGAVANISLNFLLIPQYGIYGAAIAVLISQIIACFLFDCLLKPLHKVFIMKIRALLFSLPK